MKRNKILTFTFFFALIMLLTGCIEQHTSVKIHPDGTTEVSQLVYIPKEMTEMTKKQEVNIIEEKTSEIQAEFRKEDGYTVETVSEDGKEGIVLHKTFDSPKNAFNSEFFSDETNEETRKKKTWSINVDDGFFATYVSIKANQTYEDWIKDYTGLSSEVVKLMTKESSQPEVSYSITIPVRAVKSNADEVDNRTYTWNVNPGQNTDILLEYHVLDVRNVAIAIGFFIVLLYTSVFLFIRKKKQNKAV